MTEGSGCGSGGTRIYAGYFWQPPMPPATADTYKSAFANIPSCDRSGRVAGVVYEVIDAESRHYALKTMTQQKVDTQKLQRFQNEIRFCQQTTHRNIVQLLAIERGGAGRGAGTWPV